MSSGELLLTLLVALLVFGPQKMPMLANHLAYLVKQVQRWQRQAAALWQQVELQQQLQVNQEKAKSADMLYASQTKISQNISEANTAAENLNESL